MAGLEKSPARIPALDGVRGTAILIILIGHYFASIAAPEPGAWWASLITACRLAWSGVDLFFVLSGFLIGSILLNYRQATNFYKVFYLRRICRIFPIYYLCLLVFFALLYAGGRQLSPWLFKNTMPFLVYFTFLQNINAVYYAAYIGTPAIGLGVTWSLAVEEQFYLFMPMLVRRLSKSRLWALALIIIALAIVLRCVLYSSFAVGRVANYWLLFTRADALMLGVIIALIFATPAWLERLQQKLSLVKFGLLVTGITLLILNVLKPELTASESSLMATVGFTWVDIFYACLLILILAQPQGALASVFRNRVLRWFGEISYGLYLIHLLVLGLCHALILHQAPRLSNGREALVTLLALVISLVLAKLSWQFFERPVVNWGRNHHYA